MRKCSASGSSLVYRCDKWQAIARGLVEELLAVPFVAQEQGFGEAERSHSTSWILERLQRVLQAQGTCRHCGAKTWTSQARDCEIPEWKPDPEYNLFWSEE